MGRIAQTSEDPRHTEPKHGQAKESRVNDAPQEVALGDVRKAYSMFEQLNVHILGIVENMSYFEVPTNGERYYIFGNGGGEALAERYNVPFLGGVPIAINVREGGDLGVPVVIGDPDSAQAKAFKQIAQNVAAQVSIAAVKTNRELPVLNIKRAG